ASTRDAPTPRWPTSTSSAPRTSTWCTTCCCATAAPPARRSPPTCSATGPRPPAASPRSSPPSTRPCSQPKNRLAASPRARRRGSMPDPSGFLEHGRRTPRKRPVPVRIHDNREVYERADRELVKTQASRCMDCGIPFCHNGCPLGNRIPEWNDLARTGRWGAASEQLHATNNFPEFTGRLCPAPCEAACVLGIGDDPVTIKNIEVEIIDRAFDDRNVAPRPAERSTGKSVAVVGSGPAGLAAAQQLARAGHAVTVYE